MINRLFLIATLSVLVSGCYMAPLAFIGPATSGFSYNSIIQSSLTTSANYVIKERTGKTFGQHAYATIEKNIKQSLQISYFPKDAKIIVVAP